MSSSIERLLSVCEPGFPCDRPAHLSSLWKMQSQIHIPLPASRRGFRPVKTPGWTGCSGDISADRPAGTARNLGTAPISRMARGPQQGGEQGPRGGKLRNDLTKLRSSTPVIRGQTRSCFGTWRRLDYDSFVTEPARGIRATDLQKTFAQTACRGPGPQGIFTVSPQLLVPFTGRWAA